MIITSSFDVREGKKIKKWVGCAGRGARGSYALNEALESALEYGAFHSVLESFSGIWNSNECTIHMVILTKRPRQRYKNKSWKYSSVLHSTLYKGTVQS